MELTPELKIGEQFTYQNNELKVDCCFQTLRQIYNQQHPVVP